MNIHLRELNYEPPCAAMLATPLNTQHFLAELPLFREISSDQLARIAAGTTELRAANGETLFQKGDICTGIHIVVYGHIKLVMSSAKGNEKVIILIGPGESFGEALMFTERPHVVYAQTLADTLLLHIDKAVVFKEIERQPQLARKMLVQLSGRMLSLIGDLEAYSLHSGTQRVVDYLLHAELDGESDGKTKILKISPTKGILASRLNLTPEHFSRILHELDSAQLIKVVGRAVTILDLDRLHNYASN
jgi:CRP-like cAMP-binding protein